MAEPLSSAPQAGHNGAAPMGDVTPDQMYEFIDRHEDIVAGRKSLNKQKKKLVEDIEKSGIPIESWLHFLKTREQAGVIRERIDAAWRQLQAWDAKPVGVQAGMDLTTTAAGDLNEHEVKRVDKAGFDAGKAGQKAEGNPYTPGTEAATVWQNAWARGQAAKVHEELSGEPQLRRGPGRPRKDANGGAPAND